MPITSNEAAEIFQKILEIGDLFNFYYSFDFDDQTYVNLEVRIRIPNKDYNAVNDILERRNHRDGRTEKEMGRL